MTCFIFPFKIVCMLVKETERSQILEVRNRTQFSHVCGRELIILYITCFPTDTYQCNAQEQKKLTSSDPLLWDAGILKVYYYLHQTSTACDYFRNLISALEMILKCRQCHTQSKQFSTIESNLELIFKITFLK